MKPIRDAQRDLTHERILTGAESVLRGGHPLTFARVAEAAAMPERTVYRHFETRELLEEAAWKRVLARFGSDEYPATLDAYFENVEATFARFSADPGLVRAILHSREVTHLRKIDDAPRRAALEKCVRGARPDASSGDVRRVSAVLRVLSSAPAWELLTDLWHLDAAEAAKTVKVGARSVIAGLPKTRSKGKKR